MNTSSLKLAVALAFPACMLSGCYVMVLDQDMLAKVGLSPEAPKKEAPKPAASPAPQGLKTADPSGAIAIQAGNATLYARLYPANDIASENGMVSGTVTSMMNGKGRFQITYRGEMLTGEATRVSGDDRKGVASAWGPNGSFMSCEYQMSTLVRGAGMCNFSDGARYQVHVGN
jgi:hypothetical protein